jgi:hypothetical protein
VTVRDGVWAAAATPPKLGAPAGPIRSPAVNTTRVMRALRFKVRTLQAIGSAGYGETLAADTQ